MPEVDYSAPEATWELIIVAGVEVSQTQFFVNKSIEQFAASVVLESLDEDYEFAT